MTNWRRTIALCCALAFTACGDDLEQDSETADTTQAEVPAAAPAATETVPAIDATLAEWSVTLARDSAAAGAITFQVRNTGTMPHALEVEGNGQEWATDPIQPGGNVTMSVELTAGEYKVYCPIAAGGASHESRGMVARLRVY